MMYEKISRDTIFLNDCPPLCPWAYVLAPSRYILGSGYGGINENQANFASIAPVDACQAGASAS
jgi:hypothetical protein